MKTTLEITTKENRVLRTLMRYSLAHWLINPRPSNYRNYIQFTKLMFNAPQTKQYYQDHDKTRMYENIKKKMDSLETVYVSIQEKAELLQELKQKTYKEEKKQGTSREGNIKLIHYEEEELKKLHTQIPIIETFYIDLSLWLLHKSDFKNMSINPSSLFMTEKKTTIKQEQTDTEIETQQEQKDIDTI